MTDIQDVVDDLVDEFPSGFSSRSQEDTPIETDYVPREPKKSAAEIAEIETTSNIQNISDAIEYASPSFLRSSYTADENDEFESWDPAYRSSLSGRLLKRSKDGSGVWIDMQKPNQGFGLLHIVPAKEGIISRPWESLTGEDWLDALTELHGRGARIPELERSADTPGESRPLSALPLA